MHLHNPIASCPPTIKRLLIFCGVVVVCLVWFFWKGALPPSHLDRTFGRLEQKFTTPRYAITTFLNGNRAVEQEDFYFINTRMLAYQILHANDTKCRTPIPFIVIVTNSVEAEKQKQLKRDGALVVQAEDVPTSWWIRPGLSRWAEQFTKLRILQMVQYDRVLF
jgi:alpha-N-acetylglucosamine transferase